MMKDEDREDDPELQKEEETAKKESNVLAGVIRSLTESEIRELIIKGSIVKSNLTITSEHVVIERKFLPQFEKEKEYACMTNPSCGIRISVMVNENIMQAYYCRDVTRIIK
jgi:hypothetical protein